VEVKVGETVGVVVSDAVGVLEGVKVDDWVGVSV